MRPPVARWAVLVGVVLILALFVLPAVAEEEQAAAQGTEPVLELPEAEERPRPAAWDRWSEERRRQWTERMDRAREAVRKREQTRLNAAVMAMERAAAEGVPIDQAERMAVTGLDEGLPPEEFDNLGRFVRNRVQQGLRGEALADAIHEQIRQRQQQRWQEREDRRPQRPQEEQRPSDPADRRDEDDTPAPRRGRPDAVPGRGRR